MNRITALVVVGWALVCCAFLTQAYRLTPWHELEAKNYSFEHYVSEYSKVYKDDAEYHERKAIFHANLKEVLEFNRRPNMTWKKGINHLSDRRPSEIHSTNGYVAGHTSHVLSSGSEFMQVHEVTSRSVEDLPASWDWRKHHAVTAVKDQASCGTCWAFASAEALESFYFIKTGKTMLASPQQIASCTRIPLECVNLGLGGCQGSSPILAFENLIRLNVTASEFQYPYMSWAGDNFSCDIPRSSTNLHLSGYKVVPTNDYHALMDAVVNAGPVTIIVDASGWQQYEGGIYTGCSPQIKLDHAVQLVGYGEENGLKYWIVRNSWNLHFGEKGYIRIMRNPHAGCTVDKESVECGSGTRNATVCGDCGILHDAVYPVIM